MCVPPSRRNRCGPGDLDRGSATTTAVGGRNAGRAGATYWSTTRRPMPCLAFVAPICWPTSSGSSGSGGDSADALRTGADAWMRHGLVALGADGPVVPALEPGPDPRRLAGVRPAEWRFSPATLVGMAIESLVLAVALVGLSRLVDLGFTRLEQAGPPTPATAAPGAATRRPPWSGSSGRGL